MVCAQYPQVSKLYNEAMLGVYKLNDVALVKDIRRRNCGMAARHSCKGTRRSRLGTRGPAAIKAGHNYRRGLDLGEGERRPRWLLKDYTPV